MFSIGNDVHKKGLFGLSRHFVRGSLFAVVFALIGASLVYFSQAAEQNSVRFVFFCPSDTCNKSLGSPTQDDAGNINVINIRAKNVQDWYQSKLGGRTFRMLPTKKITGSHSANYYRTNGNYPTISQRTLMNIFNESGLHEPNVHTVYVLGFNGLSNCGIATIPDFKTSTTSDASAVIDANTSVVDPFQGCSTIQNSVYAHELGHTFGLNEASDGTVMNSPTACNGKTLGNCYMGSHMRNYLLTNRTSWFPSSTMTAGAASIPSESGSWPSVLSTNQTLPSGAKLQSPNTRYELTMGGDGNLYVWDKSLGKAIWMNSKWNNPGSYLTMQPDGNLVEYSSTGVPVWSTGYGHGGTSLTMQDDGNLVLRNSSGAPVWSWMTGYL